MFTFLAVALTFPTLLYGILLGCAVLYWLLAATGLVDLDLFGGGEAGGDASAGEDGGIAGYLMRFGLGGVPLSLVLTVLLLFSWLLSYFATLFVVDGGIWATLTLSWPVRFAIMAGALIGAVPLSALSLRPARRFFARLQPVPRQSMLGLSGVVRSPELNATQGMVEVEDGGAGLILQARDETTDADGRARFRRGDRVVLVGYVEDLNAYRVAATAEPESP